MVKHYSDCIFSFDMGSNSIGWCVLGVDKDKKPERIIDMGVRIFSDGREAQSKTSLAVARREARSARRMRDRYLRRRKKTLEVLTEYGLMPADEEQRKRLLRETEDHPAGSEASKTDPYNLRLRALSEMLPKEHIGRALFHLGQRRGFKSNRKADRKSNEKGKIAVGVEELNAKMHMAKAPTLGAYLAQRRNEGHVVRIRSGSEAFNEKDYAFYPERSMLEHEFREIWNKQAEYYPEMTDERREHLFNVIFYQRPLKIPPVGRCSYNPDEPRLAKAHPLFQEFRLYKEVNELGIVRSDRSERKLTKDERDLLITLLRPKKKMSFKTLGNKLKLDPDERFNKDTENRDALVGDEVYATFSDKKAFGSQWASFDRTRQWEIISQLRDEADPDQLKAWLKAQLTLDDDLLEYIMNAALPEGYGRLGETALNEMLEKLKEDVITEAEAAKRCGYDHTLFQEGEGLGALPPYQEVLERHIPPGTGNPDDPYDIEKGRITNPTVHIGLNQLRRVVNALLKRYGKPVEMAIELARELQLSDKKRDEINKKIGKNTRDAIARSKKLQEMGVPDNGYNRQLLKLWEELPRKPEELPQKPEARICIYSGQPITIDMLFSGAVDIDHILPWSKTLDDGQGNRLLCLKQANRVKRNHAPADVMEWHSQYDDILARSLALPPQKQWRFARDAMERFKRDKGFEARQLTDTQYMSRLALAYLASLYSSEEADQHGELRRHPYVRVIPGQLTEMLRRNWGLNSLLPDYRLNNTDHPNNTNQPKNRHDHRHHAIDATVVGVTNHSLLQRISTLSGREEAGDAEDFIKKAIAEALPWNSFRDDLQEAVNRIVVSHKPDHGTISRSGYTAGKGKTAGKLHMETAYGLTGEVNTRGVPVVVYRKPFLSLEMKDLPSIRDENLQRELYGFVSGLEEKDFKDALIHFSKNHPHFKGIRRVRMTKNLNVIPIKNKNGIPYKGYEGGTNYRFDVWQMLDGKWVGEVISTFEVHQPGWHSMVHAENPAAKKILSLQQNDMVAYEHPQTGYTIARVVKFDQNKNINFVSHQEANVDQRDKNKDDPLKYFKKSAGALKGIKIRQVRVDEIGRVFDPGFKES